eukprot:TRINITY_DN22361_c0_g1_i1.p1 TRINITY_DN22361_c0_g1~~TRINITY_DN22361_c0_g1_i1.p1  ORF type:complete len:458 (+),score=101.47 TRINITY_DN22361_c0_g1_i1:131-1504(+)
MPDMATVSQAIGINEEVKGGVAALDNSPAEAPNQRKTEHVANEAEESFKSLSGKESQKTLSGKGSQQVLQDDDTLWVPKGFEIKTGAKLSENLVIGARLGGGQQGVIWAVNDEQGRPARTLVKSAGKMAIIVDIEREWRVGRELQKLRNPNGELPGFMQVFRGIRERETERMIGMEMEKINGKSMDVVLASNTFNDVNYVREMLSQVFTALALAQNQLGFHHADLRMANIMEHVDPSTGVREFKIIDYGLVKWDSTYTAGLRRATKAYYRAGKDFKGLQDMKTVAREVSAMVQSNQHPLIPLGDMGEWVHKKAWRFKGDVYHVLLDLLQFVDERIWPTKDAVSVLLLVSLLHHVTGVWIKAKFKEFPSGGIKDDFAHLAVFRRKMNKIARVFRGMSITFQGWQFPRNPDLTAAEILTSPFFQPDWMNECTSCMNKSPSDAHNYDHEKSGKITRVNTL